MCIERVGAYELGRGSDAGGGRDAGRGRARDAGSEGRGSALGAAHSSATRARTFVAAERALGFARLPDCSPAPYGSSLAVRLRLGSPMCWAVRVLSTLLLARLLFRFTPIHAAVSSQEC